MGSRMEQIIEEIEEYIDNCKYQTLSNSKIIVVKEELEELLTELRMKMPDEIKRYQKIISNKDAILADAQHRAETIISQAQVHTNELISEHQIMQQAYAQANEIVAAATHEAQEILNSATVDANNIRFASIQYTDDMLKNLEGIIGHAMETTQARTESMLSSLRNCYEVVNSNRNELMTSREEQQENFEEESYEEEPQMDPTEFQS